MPGTGSVLPNDFSLERFMPPILVADRVPGSNKVVVKPGAGGASQRCARPRRGWHPAGGRERWSARCTVRGLVPCASRSAEVDHADSPSASNASTVACRLFDLRREHDHLAAHRGDRAQSPAARSPPPAAQLRRNRPISTRSRARCNSSACAPETHARRVPLATSPGHASASARARETARAIVSETVVPGATTLRQASTTMRLSQTAPRPRRAGTSLPPPRSGARRAPQRARRVLDLGRQRGNAPPRRAACSPDRAQPRRPVRYAA